MSTPRSRRAARSFSPTRRKLLLVGVFGAVNAGLVRALGSPRSPARAPATAGEGAPTTPVALEGAAEPPPPDHNFDTVISGGRVIDPDSGYDQVANVGIDGGAVTSISKEPLKGTASIDASGLIVAPGFIDLLSYEPNSFGIWYKVADGVTTNLGMHGFQLAPGEYFDRFSGVTPTHFGGAFDDNWGRSIQAEIGNDLAGTPDQLDRLVDEFEEGIEGGWIGISFSLEYTPGVDNEEVDRLADVALKYDLPMFFHARYSDPDPPGTNAEAIEEILRVAREKGVAVHVEHITSTGGTHTMAETLATLDEARAEGIDVTACMYPYTFWATYLGSARFSPGWQERFRISYDDLVIPGTGERLTEATFEQYRSENVLAAAYAIPEEDVRTGLKDPHVFIGSDAILEEELNNHPRGAGSFARVLGHYVRDEQVIDLHQALRKMTILPAQRLERPVPALRRKGRMQIGADADITIFDPDTVIDKATVDNPAQHSEGIEYVMVLGQIVKDPNGLQTGVTPGQPITA